MSTVVIIGAGLAGLTSAQALLAKGWDVTVVDANAAPALGTSFANAGMLTPSMADPWNAPGLLPYLLKSIGHEESSFLLRIGALPSFASWGLRFLANSSQRSYLRNCEANFELARYSLERLQAWTQALGLRYEQRHNGTMKVFRTAASAKTALAVAARLERLGLEHKRLTPTEIAAQERSLAPISSKLNQGIWYPKDGSGNAYGFCEQLAHHLADNGVKFRYSESFKRWQWRGENLLGFTTDTESYHPDAIVVTAGVASPRLLQNLGLELMIRPVKGYSISIQAQGMEGMPSQPIIDEALHCALTPFENSLRIAGTAELAGFDLSHTPARLKNLRDMLREILPEQAPQLLSMQQTEWAGLRPMSADGLPYIGQARSAGLSKLFLNTGHGHLGWTHSVGSAELLADAIAGSPSNIPLAPYAANRVLGRA